MSDGPADPALAEAPEAAEQQWLAQLARSPLPALDMLLRGEVWLGAYASLDAPQALAQFVPEPALDALDGALLQWLAQRAQQSALPDGYGAKSFAKALTEAFGLLQTLSLPRSQAWCRQNAGALWLWLSSQPSFASREPRAPLLRALALVQPNRDLIDFWLQLCRQAHPRWAPLALFGLRRMPIDDEGTPPPGLPLVLVTGLIEYGLVLVRRGAAQHKKTWLSELDLLTAVYPMSRPQWADRFRLALAPHRGDAVQTLRHWLDERYPAANQPAPARSGRQQALEAPHWDRDIQPLLDRFDAESARVRPLLQAQVQRNRFYARETGDSSFLVPSFCRLAKFLTANGQGEAPIARNPVWAADLALEAARWQPGNHRCWSALAMALDAQGDWPRAQAVFWYARRRFPYNVQSHNQLGHALLMRGHVEQGEAVYRAAIRRFPDDPVCWGDLGHTLRVAGRHEESLAVYRQAQQRFHRHPPICCGLAGVLMELGRVDEAQSALQWAEQVTGDSAREQHVLKQLRQQFRALADGRPLPLRQLAARPQQSQVGDWQALAQGAGMDLRGIDALGLGALWRQRGDDGDAERAAAELETAAAQMRHGRDDTRWVAEQAWWLLAFQGPEAAQPFLDQAATQRPGDGVLNVLSLRVHGQAGDAVDWSATFQRHPELAPLLRLAQDPQATRPAELKAALASVTTPDGGVHVDDLGEDLRQAHWLYETATSPAIAELARQDFLAARQLVSG